MRTVKYTSRLKRDYRREKSASSLHRHPGYNRCSHRSDRLQRSWMPHGYTTNSRPEATFDVRREQGRYDRGRSRPDRLSYFLKIRANRLLSREGVGQGQGRGIRGNFVDAATGEEFWVSGVKRRGSNAHPAERGVSIIIDDDAQAEYHAIRSTAHGA